MRDNKDKLVDWLMTFDDTVILKELGCELVSNQDRKIVVSNKNSKLDSVEFRRS